MHCHLIVLACLLQTPADKPDAQRVISNFLQQEAVRLDAKYLDGINTKEDWEAIKPKLREQYFEMLGLWPLPERTPLHAQVTGVIERDNFRVEKLHFQSRPNLYVTGNLYLPKNIAKGEKLPAVLYVCGHSGRGRDGNKTAFQHHGMWFATNGYVCLIIDSLQLGEIAAIHHGTYQYNRWWWQARGYTPAGVECWNGIRAIDYLVSRPEVDGDKIAVTGISGGGAATFWIAAADERVKVAVPVSGMSDLEDYVGNKIVNGHCDCMFMINTFQWPWTNIAALIAPRPLLFENSGHDPIFPMPSNDRIRDRLERLYRLYTNKPGDLFDIGVTPGGHDDNPELRLMAYRWINKHLKGDNKPVTEPPLPPIDGPLLRAFSDEHPIPSDEANTTIDESFVPLAQNELPRDAASYRKWRTEKLDALRRLSFAATPREYSVGSDAGTMSFGADQPADGWIITEMDRAPLAFARIGSLMHAGWKYTPPKGESSTVWIVVLNSDESFERLPDWAQKAVGNDGVLVVAPRNTGPTEWQDKAPYYIQRSLALLGSTVDSGRVHDVAALAEYTHYVASDKTWKLAGRGQAGVIAAYAALVAPEHCIDQVLVLDPPKSHREGPIFLNVLRVVDVPEALGMIAPRPLTIHTTEPSAFRRTAAIYEAAGGPVTVSQELAGTSGGIWQPLFPKDGTPEGWSVRMWNDVSKPVPEGAVWHVESGVLVGSKYRGTWLVSDKQYGDFEMEFEFRLGERGNSGFGFRFPPAGDPAFDGLELQMADFRYNEQAKPSELTGGLYRAIAPRKQVYKPTEWNKYQIRCVGSRIQVKLNDEPILDVNVDEQTDTVKRHDGRDAPAIRDRPRRGHIGFQELSRDDVQVRIRNARIRVLD